LEEIKTPVLLRTIRLRRAPRESTHGLFPLIVAVIAL
jgi:hypothetical protein